MARVLRRIVAEKESIMWKRLETTRFSNFEDLLLTKQSIWSYLFLRHGSVLALMLNVLAIQNFLCLAKSPLCQICAPGEVNNDSKPIHSMSSMFGMSVWLPAIDFVKQSSIACDLCLHVAILGIRQLRHTFFTNLKIGGCAKVTTCPMVSLTRGIWTLGIRSAKVSEVPHFSGEDLEGVRCHWHLDQGAAGQLIDIKWHRWLKICRQSMEIQEEDRHPLVRDVFHIATCINWCQHTIKKKGKGARPC